MVASEATAAPAIDAEPTTTAGFGWDDCDRGGLVTGTLVDAGWASGTDDGAAVDGGAAGFAAAGWLAVAAWGGADGLLAAREGVD